ncbi:MAG TPA: hypothetical protein VHQ24_04145 [Lachnospiraceae bacterium]|nr:hypothetical protein [Lachnospiraceae bacterium]
MRFYEIVSDARHRYCYSIGDILWDTSNGEVFGMGTFEGEAESIPDLFIHWKEFYVSLELKKVLEMYTVDTTFRSVTLSNLKEAVQKQYYIVEAPEIEALGESTTYQFNGFVNQAVFDRTRIGDYQLFDLKAGKDTPYARKHLYANLDIVEGILRRRLWGMQFQELRLEG